jgi:hypothetical protein
MLAELSTEQVHQLYPQGELPGLTARSIRGRTLLEKEIAAIRKRGYATSSEESEEGVSSVSVAFPVERSALRLAFNTAVPVGRMGRADVKRIGELLRSTVERASHCSTDPVDQQPTNRRGPRRRSKPTSSEASTLPTRPNSTDYSGRCMPRWPRDPAVPIVCRSTRSISSAALMTSSGTRIATTISHIGLRAGIRASSGVDDSVGGSQSAGGATADPWG